MRGSRGDSRKTDGLPTQGAEAARAAQSLALTLPCIHRATLTPRFRASSPSQTFANAVPDLRALPDLRGWSLPDASRVPDLRAHLRSRTPLASFGRRNRIAPPFCFDGRSPALAVAAFQVIAPRALVLVPVSGSLGTSVSVTLVRLDRCHRVPRNGPRLEPRALFLCPQVSSAQALCIVPSPVSLSLLSSC